jgi:hypothetical protein
MYYELNNIEQVKSLEKKGFNDPYIRRNYIINNREVLKNLIKKYRNKFAFGILYNNKTYSIFKDNNTIYIRDNSKYNFEFPHCPPIISDVYCLKTKIEQEVFDFICN